MLLLCLGTKALSLTIDNIYFYKHLSFLCVLANRIDSRDLNVFGFVDDYLILYTRLVSKGNISPTFKKHEIRFNFTQNEGTRCGSQFLELKINNSSWSICSKHDLRSSELLLTHSSHHFNVLKEGNVRTVLSSLLTKTCVQRQAALSDMLVLI